MDDAESALREEIVRSCRRMGSLGINQGTSGNISARWKSGLLLTPSGLDYEAMTPDDIVFMRMDGSHDGALAPSSEWHFHRDILKSRKEINAVVHAHPIYCTALSIAHVEIPAVHYMIAAAGGPTVRCAPYATYGTAELSKNALEALKGRLCCLLANHGMIACGTDLPKAMWLAAELETLAWQYVASLQAGTPQILSNDEIERVIEKFKDYGPRSKAAASKNRKKGGT